MRGQLARLCLQARHDLEGVQHIGLAELDSNRTAVRQQLDQAFSRQHLDSFTQRRARHIEHFAELTFIEFSARGYAVFHQHLA